MGKNLTQIEVNLLPKSESGLRNYGFIQPHCCTTLTWKSIKWHCLWDPCKGVFGHTISLICLNSCDPRQTPEN